jgi:hypothetical protein
MKGRIPPTNASSGAPTNASRGPMLKSTTSIARSENPDSSGNVIRVDYIARIIGAQKRKLSSFAGCGISAAHGWILVRGPEAVGDRAVIAGSALEISPSHDQDASTPGGISG